MAATAVIPHRPTPMPPLARERALVPTLILVGLVVAVMSSLGAPLIPTIAEREPRLAERRRVAADDHAAHRCARHPDHGPARRRSRTSVASSWSALVDRARRAGAGGHVAARSRCWSSRGACRAWESG